MSILQHDPVFGLLHPTMTERSCWWSFPLSESDFPILIFVLDPNYRDSHTEQCTQAGTHTHRHTHTHTQRAPLFTPSSLSPCRDLWMIQCLNIFNSNVTMCAHVWGVRFKSGLCVCVCVCVSLLGVCCFGVHKSVCVLHTSQY